MNVEQPATGFNGLSLKNQVALAYAGVPKGVFHLPPHPVKFAVRMDEGSSATVQIQMSNDEGASWETGVEFVMDTVGEWTVGPAVNSDMILVKAVVSGSGVNCVMGA